MFSTNNNNHFWKNKRSFFYSPQRVFFKPQRLFIICPDPSSFLASDSSKAAHVDIFTCLVLHAVFLGLPSPSAYFLKADQRACVGLRDLFTVARSFHSHLSARCFNTHIFRTSAITHKRDYCGRPHAPSPLSNSLLVQRPRDLPRLKSP